MARTKKAGEPATYEDVEKAIREMTKEILAEFKTLLASKTDISDFSDRIIAKLDRMDQRMVKYTSEVRQIRILYEFWAERHLTPDLMEEFLEYKEQKRRSLIKKVD